MITINFFGRFRRRMRTSRATAALRASRRHSSLLFALFQPYRSLFERDIHTSFPSVSGIRLKDLTSYKLVKGAYERDDEYEV
jgi:hypothetical protein